MRKKILAIALMLMLVISALPSVAAAADVDPFTLAAPQNLKVELKHSADGIPYFLLKLDVPQSVKDIDRNLIEDSEYYTGKSCYPISVQFDFKYADYDWNEGPSLYWSTEISVEDFLADGGVFEYAPFGEYASDGEIDIKAEVYSFRAYFFSDWGYEGDWIDFKVTSGYSNTVTIGNDAYYSGASEWAKPELDRAAQHGLIPDSIKDKMSSPITREEFAELAVLLYEKTTGKKAQPVSPNPFIDTTNPEILKANQLGIINGIGNKKFDPKSLTNREQVATMLSRAIRVMVPDADFSIEGAPSFTDEKLISSWALEHVKFMSKIGVIKGSNGKFMPKATTTAEIASKYATTTCEQATVMALRVYENYN